LVFGPSFRIAVDVAVSLPWERMLLSVITIIQDRTLKEQDHAAPLEPEGLRKIKSRFKSSGIKLATFKSQDILHSIEQVQRDKLKTRRDSMFKNTIRSFWWNEKIIQGSPVERRFEMFWEISLLKKIC
jgi:hypothetical protein